jgi:lipid-A-disaccharide synthase
VNQQQTVFFIAGDPSGDEHASHVVKRLRELRPAVQCVGIGGPAMERAGFRALMPFAPFNRMGLSEVLSALPFFARAKRFVVSQLKQMKPSLVVCVDYSGFNIPIMKAAHSLGFAVLWYIPPKVWAWKKKRAAILGEHASCIAAILPFEPQYFKGFRAKVEYVGNPCVEALEKSQKILSAPVVKQYVDAAKRPWRIALVPGSRRQEIRRILPVMAEAAASVRSRYKVEIRTSVHPALDRSLFAPYIDTHNLGPVSCPLHELLAWADVALITSGTATLEAALMGVPHVLVYRMTRLNSVIFKLVANAPFIGLPNIIAGKEIVPECMQKAAEPDRLAAELVQFIDSRDYYNSTIANLSALKDMLGAKLPSEEVSRLIQGFLH